LDFTPYLPVFLILFWPIHFVPVPIATTSFVTEKRNNINLINYHQKHCSHTVVLVRQHTEGWVEGKLQGGTPCHTPEEETVSAGELNIVGRSTSARKSL